MPTLIIEDGTLASASANTYVEVIDVDTFCENYGLSSWAALATADKETAIFRGMAYIETFGFKGEKVSYDDPLEWPRYGVYDEGIMYPSLELPYYQEIPKGLKNAACRAAYEESVDAGVLQQTKANNVKKEKIDVIEYEYFSMQPSENIYSTIQGFLKGLIRNTNTATVKRT